MTTEIERTRDRIESETAAGEGKATIDRGGQPAPSSTQSGQTAIGAGHAASQTTAKELWRPEILPYVLKLADHVRKSGARDRSVSLPIAQYRVLLSPQEQELMAAFTGSFEAFGANEALLIESLGLQIKIFSGLKKIGNSDDPNDKRGHERLARDRDSALLLGREMTIAVRRARDSGEVADADRLQASRNRMSKAVTEIEDVIGTEPERNGGNAKKSQYVYDWNEIAARPNAKPPDTASSPAQHKGPASRQPDPRTRFVRNCIIFAVLCVTLSVLIINLWVHRQRQLKDFTVQDLAEVPGVELVVNRSPTLLIVVDQSKWGTLASFEKRKALETVGALIKSEGYQEAEIRSREGSTMAVWRRTGKIEITD